ncbi:MAG: DoxX family membrane protein [Desulfobacterales bacterium]|nr:DoxX family membrane protein [Desulfobacterales bacterium]
MRGDDIMRGQFLYHAARIVLGLIFLFACYDKILHPGEFAEVVYNYQLLPDSLVNVTAILLPWVELALGLSLIFNVWIPGAVLLGNLLLVAFFSALLFNLARGLDVSCGCFSTAPGEEAIDHFTVLRDMSFLLVSGYLFYAALLSGSPAAEKAAWPRAETE